MVVVVVVGFGRVVLGARVGAGVEAWVVGTSVACASNDALVAAETVAFDALVAGTFPGFLATVVGALAPGLPVAPFPLAVSCGSPAGVGDSKMISADPDAVPLG